MNASAYSYAVSISSQMEDICKPLLELGINYFNYMKIYNNGTYINLDNDIKYIKAYLSVIEDVGEFFTYNNFSNANLDKYNYCLLGNLRRFDSQKDPIMHLLYDFNKINNLTIYKISKYAAKYAVYESYNFSTIQDHSYHSSKFWLNNIELLEHFINYFNEKAKTFTNTNDKSKLAYLQKTFNFYNLPEHEILTKKIKDFLIKTKLQNRSINGVGGQVKLAKREFECLEYLALGKSMKEIGHILDLSLRTIEFYLRNTKSKTSYKSKNKLLAQFIKDI